MVIQNFDILNFSANGVHNSPTARTEVHTSTLPIYLLLFR